MQLLQFTQGNATDYETLTACFIIIGQMNLKILQENKLRLVTYYRTLLFLKKNLFFFSSKTKQLQIHFGFD